MFSLFKKKKVVAHLRLSGIIGNAGKFKQGIDFAGQEELIKKAFSLKKASCVAITINSPGGSPVQSHLIYSCIRQQAKKNKKKVIVFAEDVAASGGYLISCALPIPSINPKFFALLPDQNSPEKSSTSDLFNFDPLLFSTTSIKSL